MRLTNGKHSFVRYEISERIYKMFQFEYWTRTAYRNSGLAYCVMPYLQRQIMIPDTEHYLKVLLKI